MGSVALVKMLKNVKTVKMTLPALVGVYTISVNSEKSATDENGGNGMDRWGVGCVT